MPFRRKFNKNERFQHYAKKRLDLSGLNVKPPDMRPTDEIEANAPAVAAPSQTADMDLDLDIIPHTRWRENEPLWRGPVKEPFKYVFFSNTDSKYCMLSNSCFKRLKTLQIVCERRDNQPDISFNFLIGGDAKIYEGRGWSTRPTLPTKYIELQGKSLYVGFVGRFQDRFPAPKMFKIRDELVKYGVMKGYITSRFLEFTV